VSSLARPGGNVTGLSIVGPELAGKALQWLKEAIAGSGIRFVDRGVRTLKGIPGEWRLFAVAGE
jgi:hypothetical protein